MNESFPDTLVESKKSDQYTKNMIYMEKQLRELLIFILKIRNMSKSVIDIFR